MREKINTRKPPRTRCGWSQISRDPCKIRLHLAGKLHPDYQPNYGKGFDGTWLKAAGLTHEQFEAVVRNTITDGQVAGWVLKNVKRSEAEKKAHAEGMLSHPKPEDAEGQA